MRRDILSDLYGDRHMLDDLGRMLRDEDMLISGLLREAPWYVLQDGMEEDGGAFPLTERLAQAADGRNASVFRGSPINTYPFGEPTEQTFPEFLGICSGDTALDEVLGVARDHCEKARQCLPKDLPKTVMIFTDKWDWPMFHQKFELPFLRYALEDNVLFIFLLVTDYGVSRIPFCGKNHAELERLRENGYGVESEHPGVSAMRVLKRSFPCTYECHSGTWAQYGSSYYHDDHYSFDFRSMKCTMREGGQEERIFTIPKKAAQKFAATVCEFLDQRGRSYSDPMKACDAGSCRATVAGVELSWFAVGTDSLDRPCQIIAKAFGDLIGALREVR